MKMFGKFKQSFDDFYEIHIEPIVFRFWDSSAWVWDFFFNHCSLTFQIEIVLTIVFTTFYCNYDKWLLARKEGREFSEFVEMNREYHFGKIIKDLLQRSELK